MSITRETGLMMELNKPGGYAPFGAKIEPVKDEKYANIVSSEVKGLKDIHAPAIDIDLPCRLVESSTPGHFHLYIDHLVSWDKYKAVLASLADAGIVEQGYYEASVARGASYLRKPGIEKVPQGTAMRGQT